MAMTCLEHVIQNTLCGIHPLVQTNYCRCFAHANLMHKNTLVFMSGGAQMRCSVLLREHFA